MKSLTGLDATFLYLETPEMPMHVGSLNLCELPAGFRGSFHKEVTQHVARRMYLAPVLSRKLVFMPLDLGHPLWVEADSVDIGFHIRRAPPTPFNAGIGSGRVFVTAPLPLAECKALAKVMGGAARLAQSACGKRCPGQPPADGGWPVQHPLQP